MLVPSEGAGRKGGNGDRGARWTWRPAHGPERRRAPQVFSPRRTIVLVGLMGAGKTKIGRRLAARLNLPFSDSDNEIETAAGETIEEIFRKRGEAVFRDGERRVIARLLEQPPHILATGGGAFMDPATRALIARRGVSVWLRADLDVLVARVSRRNNRPLLQRSDPRSVLAELIERRHPVYAEADIVDRQRRRIGRTDDNARHRRACELPAGVAAARRRRASHEHDGKSGRTSACASSLASAATTFSSVPA